MALLEVVEVSRAEGTSVVVHPISFALEPGSKVAIMGATGSGKSSLLKLIAGLLQPTQGSIYFNGEKVLGPDEQLLPGHSWIAYLSQHFELRNNYHVYELLEMASKIEKEEAEIIFRICDIDHLLKRRSNQLSGGERQRISLAAALIRKPGLLLLDEPFSNADMLHKEVLKNILEQVNTQLKTAIIMVSHDPLDILPWAEQLLVLKEGRLIQTGTPDEIYYDPKNEYVASLTGHYNILTPTELRSLGLSPTSETATKIIRPQELTLNTNGEGVAATITKKNFLGSCFLIIAVAEGHEIKVITTMKQWEKGEQVFISFCEH